MGLLLLENLTNHCDEVHPRNLGNRYEKIMRRMFPHTKGNRNGCNSYLMIRLVDSEMCRQAPEKFQKHYGAPSVPKQTERIRKNIYVGIDRLKKEIRSESELNDLLNVEDDVEYAQSFRTIILLLERINGFISSKEIDLNK